MERKRYVVESMAMVRRRYEVAASDAKDALELASGMKPAHSQDESESFISAAPVETGP